MTRGETLLSDLGPSPTAHRCVNCGAIHGTEEPCLPHSAEAPTPDPIIRGFGVGWSLCPKRGGGACPGPATEPVRHPTRGRRACAAINPGADHRIDSHTSSRTRCVARCGMSTCRGPPPHPHTRHTRRASLRADRHVQAQGLHLPRRPATHRHNPVSIPG